MRCKLFEHAVIDLGDGDIGLIEAVAEMPDDIPEIDGQACSPDNLERRGERNTIQPKAATRRDRGSGASAAPLQTLK